MPTKRPDSEFLRALHGPLMHDAEQEVQLALKVAVLKADGRSRAEIERATGATGQEIRAAEARLRRVVADLRDQ